MKIYQIEQAQGYKHLIFDEGKDFNSLFLTRDWEELSRAPKPFRMKFAESGKDFDASCYYGGVLIVNEKIKRFFEEKIANLVKISPIVTDAGQFYFVNVINAITAIDDSVPGDVFMKMVAERKFPFARKVAIGEGQLLFRDLKFTADYFVTDKFIEVFGAIAGLQYALRGEAL
ncbi:MAG: hypothetical protein LBU73_01570 [Helicobacteraceae bacterium]|jgi:hypothetical protein|nr:hypothetical protein [Helicobacteraceae bacterium]